MLVWGYDKREWRWIRMTTTDKSAFMFRLVGFKYIGLCDKCHHAVGYLKDSHVLLHYLDLFPDDELSEDIAKTHCKNPSFENQKEKNLVKLAELFEQVKDFASQRAKALNKFSKEWEDVFGTELPMLADCEFEIDWQDVLLWGIKDASFVDFLRDIKVNFKEAGF